MTIAAPADSAATGPTSRRALLGAGVVGAALAVAGSGAVNAAAPRPADDLAVAELAIAYELAARDLYDAAIAAGSADPLWLVLREHHESYAQRVSGLVGQPARVMSAEMFDARSGAFSTPEPVAAAMELENALAATHTEWLAVVTSPKMAIAMASIAALEARHAVVLGIRAGITEGDALFVNPAAALSGEA